MLHIFDEVDIPSTSFNLINSNMSFKAKHCSKITEVRSKDIKIDHQLSQPSPTPTHTSPSQIHHWKMDPLVIVGSLLEFGHHG